MHDSRIFFFYTSIINYIKIKIDLYTCLPIKKSGEEKFINKNCIHVEQLFVKVFMKNVHPTSKCIVFHVQCEITIVSFNTQTS